MHAKIKYIIPKKSKRKKTHYKFLFDFIHHRFEIDKQNYEIHIKKQRKENNNTMKEQNVPYHTMTDTDGPQFISFVA